MPRMERRSVAYVEKHPARVPSHLMFTTGRWLAHLLNLTLSPPCPMHLTLISPSLHLASRTVLAVCPNNKVVEIYDTTNPAEFKLKYTLKQVRAFLLAPAVYHLPNLPPPPHILPPPFPLPIMRSARRADHRHGLGTNVQQDCHSVTGP